MPDEAAEELQGLRADDAQVHFGAARLRLADRDQGGLEQIQVERSAQAAVGADHHDADRVHRALERERMLVVQIDLAQVADDLADLFRIGTRRAHAVLRLAHLAGRHHFQRLGDLAGIFDTRDLAPDFFCACHYVLFCLRPYSVAKNSSQHFFKEASTSLVRSGLPLMVLSRSP